MVETEKPDLVEHYLGHATRQQLLNELASRNLATFVMYDCIIPAAGGANEVKSICSYHGPLTQLYGLLCIHPPRIMDGIQRMMSRGDTVTPENTEGS